MEAWLVAVILEVAEGATTLEATGEATALDATVGTTTLEAAAVLAAMLGATTDEAGIVLRTMDPGLYGMVEYRVMVLMNMPAPDAAGIAEEAATDAPDDGGASICEDGAWYGIVVVVYTVLAARPRTTAAWPVWPARSRPMSGMVICCIFRVL